MSGSKSIFEKPTNEEINTLLFKEGQFPTIINDADDSAQDKNIGQEVKRTDQDSKIDEKNSDIISSDNHNPEIKQNTLDSKENNSNTNQKSSNNNPEIAETKNKSSVDAVKQQITSTNNTDPTRKTSNDDDTGVNLQLRLPKKNVSNKK
jgi:hypothetical protein